MLCFFLGGFSVSDASSSVWRRLQRTTLSSWTRKDLKVGLSLSKVVAVATVDGDHVVFSLIVSSGGDFGCHCLSTLCRYRCEANWPAAVLCGGLSERTRVITLPFPQWPSSVTLETTCCVLHNCCRYFTLISASVCVCVCFVGLRNGVKLKQAVSDDIK